MLTEVLQKVAWNLLEGSLVLSKPFEFLCISRIIDSIQSCGSGGKREVEVNVLLNGVNASGENVKLQ